MIIISKQFILCLIFSLVSMAFLSAMEKGKGRQQQRSNNPRGGRGTTQPTVSQTEENVVATASMTEQAAAAPARVEKEPRKDKYRYEVAVNMLPKKQPKDYFTTEFYKVTRSATNIYCTVMSEGDSTTSEIFGLVLPVCYEDYQIIQMGAMNPEDKDKMLIVFAFSHEEVLPSKSKTAGRPAKRTTSGISFVSPCLVDVEHRPVIYIPFQILCFKIQGNNLVVAVKNNDESTATWSTCFVRYEFDERAMSFTKKSAHYVSDSAMPFQEGDVKISLNAKMDDFVDFQIGDLPPRKEIICTHSNKFHPDELLAIAMLCMLEKYNKAGILRSRDEEVWRTATVLVDVGKELSLSGDILKFDHHQSTFNQKFSVDSTALMSSAGLIYKNYGKAVIRKLLEKRKNVLLPSEGLVHAMYLDIYADFIEEIDARDNGHDIPYSVDRDFIEEAFNLALKKLPVPEPSTQKQGNQRQQGKKGNQAKKATPAQQGPSAAQKAKMLATTTEAIDNFHGIKFLPRYSGRLGLSAIFTQVKMLNEASLSAARKEQEEAKKKASETKANASVSLTEEMRPSAAQISEDLALAETLDAAEELAESLQKVRETEIILEEKGDNVFSKQRDVHFMKGVDFLHSFFLEAFDEAWLKNSHLHAHK